MSLYIPPQPNVSLAWLETLDVVSGAGGRAVNVLTTITDPGAVETQGIRDVLDRHLLPARAGIQPVQTVANTIFPQARYRYSGPDFSPSLMAGDLEQLDDAAQRLYEGYGRALPTLLRFHGNKSGTYFSRMISWPGKTSGGRNQLADRIRALRGQHGNSAYNASDIVIGGEAMDESAEPDSLRGVQVYSERDGRVRGFPCMVHIDLTLYEGKLSLIATYRHQYLVTKAYGNLLGLARLHRFLSQQTGFPMGELAVMATLADAEHTGAWSKTKVKAIIQSASAANGGGLF